MDLDQLFEFFKAGDDLLLTSLRGGDGGFIMPVNILDGKFVLFRAQWIGVELGHLLSGSY